MIQDRKKFTDMIYNILWLYIVLVISQLILYFYYPEYFAIYETFITYLYSIVKEIFDYLSFMIAEVFNNFGNTIIVVGTIILCFTFYEIFMKITNKVIRGGK
jgi:uncharacterized protein YacL